MFCCFGGCFLGFFGGCVWGCFAVVFGAVSGAVLGLFLVAKSFGKGLTGGRVWLMIGSILMKMEGGSHDAPTADLC